MKPVKGAVTGSVAVLLGGRLHNQKFALGDSVFGFLVGDIQSAVSYHEEFKIEQLSGQVHPFGVGGRKFSGEIVLKWNGRTEFVGFHLTKSHLF